MENNRLNCCLSGFLFIRVLGVDHGVALADGFHVKGNALPVRPELIPRPGRRVSRKPQISRVLNGSNTRSAMHISP